MAGSYSPDSINQRNSLYHSLNSLDTLVKDFRSFFAFLFLVTITSSTTHSRVSISSTFCSLSAVRLLVSAPDPQRGRLRGFKVIDFALGPGRTLIFAGDDIITGTLPVWLVLGTIRVPVPHGLATIGVVHSEADTTGLAPGQNPSVAF